MLSCGYGGIGCRKRKTESVEVPVGEKKKTKVEDAKQQRLRVRGKRGV